MLYFIIGIILVSFLYQYFTKSRTEEGCGKTVSRTSFQYRLIKWTLGKDPKFTGYCPFFWAFWLCLFLIPITAVCKLVEFIFKSEKKEKKFEMSMDWLEFYYNNPDHYEYSRSDQEKEWMNKNPDWRERVEKYLAAKALKAELAAKRQEKKDYLAGIFKSKMDFAGKYLSYLIKPGLILGALGIAYCLYLALSTAVSFVSLKDFLTGFVIAVSICGLVWIVKKAYSWLSVAARVVEKVNIPLPQSDSVFWTKVAGIILFIPRLIIKTWQKECPIITYKD